ncbi:MAG TPA: hypothetical protein VJ824_06085 [Bacillota bacterium]|nr:hypothetical protein [Bacillota bacterium]
MGDDLEQGKAIASLEAKMDLVLKFIEEIKASLATNYVQKVQFEDLKLRVDKLEGAGHRWIPIILTAIASIAAVIALFIKQ